MRMTDITGLSSYLEHDGQRENVLKAITENIRGIIIWTGLYRRLSSDYFIQCKVELLVS